MKSSEIVEALKSRHSAKGLAREWAYFEELRVGTGMVSYGNVEKHTEQRIDFWAINCYPSKNFLRIAYEIKVSRSDFKHEIDHPEKRQRALELSNEFYFVVPKGLVRVEEVPEECGLIYVNENLRSRLIKQAPYREAPPPDMSFFCAIARRASD